MMSDDDQTLEAERLDQDGDELARAEDAIPSQLIALPLNQRPVFPTMMLPLVIPEGRLSDAV
ncbi:MAG: hypothetical protein ACYTF0_09260, partial [Planctomycetota bacterium]